MKHTLATLSFFAKYEGWHSFYTSHTPTKRAVERLRKLGFLEVIGDQARFTGKTVA